ncbi:hypothetical protein [Duganella sp.]|uniref:hypothetical protein n=1 Tax=Duganella sp. TaxID=1904440 RepID=UPI0031DDFF1A
MKKSKATSKSTSKRLESAAASGDFLDFDISEKEDPIAHDGEDDAPISEYEERYVAFIDILGFKELISASQHQSALIGPSLIFNALDIRHSSVQDAFLARVRAKDVVSADLDFMVQSFSDCVVASCKKNPLGLGLLLFFCWQISSDWLSKSFLSRGGIACGKPLHKPNKGGASVLFGLAFIQAYKLESEVADYPRIISKEVRAAHAALEVSHFPANSHCKEVIQALVTRFPDGPTGIDIFAHLRDSGFDRSTQSYQDDAAQYHRALTSHLSNASDMPHFYRKVLWQVDRFNTAILRTTYADKHIE